ncbi:MAG: hypothetical protein KGJ43_06265, partial [Acidobacteriota bacterium]|nr:hypothetical protein [Acidobacteriota bacterium]
MLKAAARLRSGLTYANVTATIALFVALGGGAYATTSLVARSGVIRGCVKKKGGALAVIRPGRRCPKGTVALSFDAEGHAGRQGAQGPTGQAGPAGQAGTNAVAGPPTGPAGGDLGGSYPNPVISRIGGQLPVTQATALGGGLAGTLPNPTIAPGAVGSADFAAGAKAPDAAALEGIPASGFIQGSGRVVTGRETITESQRSPLGPAEGIDNLLLTVNCDVSSTGTLELHLSNYNAEPVPVWIEVAGAAPTEKALGSGGGEAASPPALSSASSVERVSYRALTTKGPVTITVWALAAANSCTIS